MKIEITSYEDVRARTAANCKKGGFVIQHHGDVKAEWHHLCAQAIKPSAVTDELLIQTSRDVRQAGAIGTEPAPEERGDVAAHGFWRPGTTTVFDVRITDTDCATHCKVDPIKVLRQHEAKKKKYNELRLARRRTFTPLVFSVDGLHGPEAIAATKQLASLLAKKWNRTYSELVGYVRLSLSVALVRSSSQCFRVDRDPFVRRPTTPWETGTGLSLYQ